MRLALVVVVLGIAAAPSPAHAGNNLQNWLIGPVFGIRLGNTHGQGTAILGVEGGGGAGPERFNLGFEHRSDHDVFYAELDPWYLIGGTVGIGFTDKGDAVPVLGLWEGFPLNGGSCSGWHDQLTISGGYRYTGVHELYVSLKAGRMDGEFCWGD